MHTPPGAASLPRFPSGSVSISRSFPVSHVQIGTLFTPSPQPCAVSSSLLTGACRFKHEISTNKCFLHALLCGFAVYAYAPVASLPCNSLPQVSVLLARATPARNKHFMCHSWAQITHIYLTLLCTSLLFKHTDIDCSVINSYYRLCLYRHLFHVAHRTSSINILVFFAQTHRHTLTSLSPEQTSLCC